uniref:Gustatory receptor n=1 Tax=Trichogramma kaykai TaxID=54128 RepID=A0ABD2XSZ8_9HYME
MSKNIRERCAFYYLKIFGLTGNIDFKNSKQIDCLHYYSTKLPLFSAVYSVVFVSILISSQCNSIYEMSLIQGYKFNIVVEVFINLLISLAYVDFFTTFYRKHEAIREVLKQMNAVRILTDGIEKNRDKKSPPSSINAIEILYSITFVLILSKVVLHVTFCLYKRSWDFEDFGDHMLDLLMHAMTMHYITTVGVCHAAFKAINRSLLSLVKRFNLLFSRKIVLSKEKPSLMYNIIMDQQQPREISIYRNYNNARFNEQVTKLKTYYAVVVKLAQNLSSLYQTVLFLCVFRYFITIISSCYTLAEIVVCNNCPLTPILDICKHLFNIIFHLVSLVMLTGLATVTLNEVTPT